MKPLCLFFAALVFPLLATEPKPISAQDVERLDREQFARLRYDAKRGETNAHYGLETLNLACGRPAESETAKKPTLERVLETYPDAVVKQLLDLVPAKTCPHGFLRGFRHLDKRRFDRAKLIGSLREFLRQGEGYFGSGLPPAETAFRQELARTYLTCAADEEITLVKEIFCRDRGTSDVKRTSDLEHANGPASLTLGAEEKKFLSDGCARKVLEKFECPRPETSSGPLACKTDDDCIAVGNGCGIAAVVGRSAAAHRRFACRCERGPFVFGCVRKHDRDH